MVMDEGDNGKFRTERVKRWPSVYIMLAGQGWGRLQLMITITVMITCHFYLSITIMITIIRHYNYRLRL